MSVAKYHNKRSIGADGFVYASRREHRRYAELRLMEKAGLIKDLQRQVKYSLIPSQRDADGKLIEHGVDYVADFAYIDAAGNLIVEDAKGAKTQAYIIKRKLMLHVYGIRIREV